MFYIFSLFYCAFSILKICRSETNMIGISKSKSKEDELVEIGNNFVL